MGVTVCEVCGVEYPSYEAWVYRDRCELSFDEASPNPELVERGSAYSRDPARAMAALDARRDGSPSSGSSSSPSSSATGATPKQRAFISKLAAERGLEVKASWVASKAGASDAIDKLLAMPKKTGRLSERPPSEQAMPAPSPTDKQVAFMERLARERGVTIEADWLSSKAAASAALDRLAALPKVAPSTPPASPLERGDVHLVDGTYYRVHVSQRTGALYAAAFDVGEQAFVYARGAIARLTPANRVTADEAAAFGKMYGRCVFCSRLIDTPESTAVGYGPICAARHGLPWGTSIPAPEPTAAPDDEGSVSSL